VATQQINQAYTVLLASQFQGFCRDLHSECVDYLVATVTPAALQPVLRAEFTWGRQLDRGNEQPGSIGTDFNRFGVAFWTQVEGFDSRNAGRRILLEELNTWRNAIAHQNFDPSRLGGTTTLQLARVRRWRVACRHLARGFDEVMRRHLQALLGPSPW
jgi:hypothetical protein